MRSSLSISIWVWRSHVLLEVHPISGSMSCRELSKISCEPSREIDDCPHSLWVRLTTFARKEATCLVSALNSSCMWFQRMCARLRERTLRNKGTSLRTPLQTHFWKATLLNPLDLKSNAAGSFLSMHAKGGFHLTVMTTEYSIRWKKGTRGGELGQPSRRSMTLKFQISRSSNLNYS